MKTLLLSADDIQNFNQLIYDTNTAAHFVNVAAAKQLNNTTTITTTNNNNTNSTLTISNNNNNNNNNNSTNKNLMALQYYLKQSGNYVPSSNTTSAAAVGVMSLPQLQQQQLQNVLAASTTTTAAAASALAQYQQQLQQQQQQHHLNHQHQQQQQQQQQLLAQSQTQLKHLQLKQPTIHHQHTSNYHHHPYYQQQQQTHHQQQQQQNAHHQLQQQLQLHQQKQQQQQQQHHQLNSSSHLHQQQFHHQLLNIPNATTTTTSSSAATTTQKKTTSSTPNVPVHALNQNSNFSAASSSTGGGTISSHAPTQQSNGSSLSPPARQPQHQQQQHQNSTHLIAHIKTPVPTITKTSAPPTASSISTATRAVAINATIQRVNGVVAKVAVPATSASGTTVSVTSNTQCGKKIKGEPLLSEHYQSERLNFAKSFIVWNEDHWKRVIFQDERKFNLDGPDGFSYYFHDLRNYERTLSQRPRGNSVYVYLIISSNGPIHLEVSSSKFRLETCIETIMRERTNIINKLGGNSDFLVQDHNWSANASVATQEWLNGDHLKIQKWPTIAHDLNIMENIWGWLIREVYDGGRKFSRKDDLIFRIKEAWARLPKDLVTNLYSTLPERITELYYTRGIYTNC